MRILTGYLFVLLCVTGLKTSLPQQDYVLADTSEAQKYFNHGKTFLETAKYDSALLSFERSNIIYSSLAEKFDNQSLWKSSVNSLNRIGRTLIALGKIDSSYKLLNNTLNLSINKTGNKSAETADSYFYLGNACWYNGNYDESLSNYNTALAIRISLSGEENIEVADIYNGIGIVYAEKADHDKAVEYFQRSLDLKIKIFGEDNPLVAIAYNNLGNIYKDREDLDKAIQLHEKALDIRLRLLKENHPHIASSYSNLGLVYYKQGDYNKAVDVHQKALSIRLKQLGEKHLQVASSCNNLGLAYWKLNLLDSALVHHQKSLMIRQQILGEEHNDVAKSYMNIGLVYFEKGEDEKALEQYNKGLQINLNLLGDKHFEVSHLYQNMTEVYMRRKDFNTALSYCQKTISSLIPEYEDSTISGTLPLDNIISETDLLNALKTKAMIVSSLIAGDSKANYADVLSIYNSADKLIEKIRTGYRNEGSKLFLGEKASVIYDRAIQTCINLFESTRDDSYKNKAFYFAERSKAVVLYEQLAESKAKQFGKLPSNIVEEEKRLKVSLAFYDSQLQNEILKKNKSDAQKINGYRDSLFSLSNDYEKFVAKLEKDFPEYYRLKYDSRTPGVNELQNKLNDATTVVQYFTGEKSIYIFVISQNSYDVLSVNKPENFSELIKNFYSSIVKAETQKYLSSAEALSGLLIYPIKEKIINAERIVFVPHDILYKIPFEALFGNSYSAKSNNQVDYSELPYLVKIFDIQYQNSAALYLNSLEADRKSNDKNFIGFAPVFSKTGKNGYTINNVNIASVSSLPAEVLRSVSADGKNYDELKYSEWEVKSALEILASKTLAKQSAGLFYEDASETSFKTNVSRYDIIHIASHSFINDEHPELSGIVFAKQDEIFSTDDGILYSNEAYNLELNADLVVLSSCESGIGKLVKGEGLMALTRGFIYSGADNIIFSLWKIPDKHTSELMVEFYKQVAENKNYSESLRHAKLNLIKDNLTARPRSWAGFVLIGGNN
ncbi:MAG: CHAT domain-containing protein [Ignavibacteriales bacterium]|nr:MAG: CHAT domain-containing protein [Ignavibacteriales bacterium]